MGWINDLLQGIPLNAVLKERVALAEQKFKDLADENKNLAAHVTALTLQMNDLTQEVETMRGQLELQAKVATQKPTLQGEYYKFEGEEGLFCTNCFDSGGRKVRTVPMLGRVRSCPQCKTMIGR